MSVKGPCLQMCTWGVTNPLHAPPQPLLLTDGRYVSPADMHVRLPASLCCRCHASQPLQHTAVLYMRHCQCNVRGRVVASPAMTMRALTGCPGCSSSVACAVMVLPSAQSMCLVHMDTQEGPWRATTWQCAASFPTCLSPLRSGEAIHAWLDWHRSHCKRRKGGWHTAGKTS
jgi:hypothetical protein